MSADPQSMVYGAVPPETASDAVPSARPLQVASVVVAVATSTDGSVMVTLSVSEQLLLSLTV